MPQRIPVGTTLDRGEATRIAKEPARLAASHAYWHDRLASVGEDVLDRGTLSSPAMRLAAAMPSKELAALLPARQYVFEAGDKPVKLSGCLVSAEEIARFVDTSLTAADLAGVLGALRNAATGAGAGSAPPVESVAQGVVVCREVFDAVRRYRVCAEHAARYKLDVATVVALYRQEGSLAISPPASSYAHGPLIKTATGTCRPPDLPLAFDPTAVRPGFNLVHAAGGFGTSLKNPVSQGFGLAFRNMLALGGLDSLVNPRLSANDELRQLLRLARKATPLPAPLAALDKAVRDQLAKGFGQQQLIFDEMCVGVLMCILDELPPGASLPQADDLLESLRLEITSLVSAHGSTRSKSGDVLLSAADDAPETRVILDLQARWFASRVRLTTLLARSDRSGAVAFDLFSPFLAYLRFNVGDALFAGLLLRSVVEMDTIRKAAQKQPWPQADGFLNALAKSDWVPAAAKRLKTLLVTHWATGKVGTEEAWRHIGLIEALKATGVPPMWLLGKAMPPTTNLAKTAAVARELVTVFVESDLMPVIEELFLRAPITRLLGFGVSSIPDPASARLPWVRAHSFDRLRVVYAAALADAGLGSAAGL